MKTKARVEAQPFFYRRFQFVIANSACKREQTTRSRDLDAGNKRCQRRRLSMLQFNSRMVVVVTLGLLLANVPPAKADIVGWWKFDEGSGQVAADSSGFGNTGQLNNPTWIAPGALGPYALHFTATPYGSQFVRVLNALSLQPTVLTVEAWVRRNGSPGAYRYVIAKGTDGVAASYAMYTSSGGLSFYVYNVHAFYLSPDAGIGIWDGKWHQAVGTFDGSVVRFYVDGAQVGSGTTVPPGFSIEYGLSTTDLLFGSYNILGSYQFDGDVDDVAVWNRALTQSEIQSLHDNGFPNAAIPTLISGGADNTNPALPTAELYDPSKGTFAATGNMAVARALHTETPLSNGKLLVTGGFNPIGVVNSTELYDPSSKTFAVSAPMNSPRAGHTATSLQNGKVLLAGGLGSNSRPSNTAEVYDPSNGSFAVAGSMTRLRAFHTATLLNDGTVFITGGSSDNFSVLSTAEIYNPATNAFTGITQTMFARRTAHSASLLKDGRVLLAGGSSFCEDCGALASAELYNPSTGTFSLTGSMIKPRLGHTATISNNKVLVVGGTLSTRTGELYDPASGSFTCTDGSAPTAGACPSQTNMSSVRVGNTATLLDNGRVLITGGLNLNSSWQLAPTASADLYDPSTGLFTATGNMTQSRAGHRAPVR